jgi:hypothetical protein
MESALWLRTADMESVPWRRIIDKKKPDILCDAMEELLTNALFPSFVAYAACNWVYHLQRSAFGPKSAISTTLIDRLAVFSQQYLPLWTEFHSTSQGSGLNGAAGLLEAAFALTFKVSVVLY